MKSMKMFLSAVLLSFIMVCMGKNELKAQYAIAAIQPPIMFTHLDLWHFYITGTPDTNYVEFYVAVRIFDGENTLLVKSQSPNFQMLSSSLYVAPTNLGPLDPLTIAYTVDGFYANIVNTGGQFPAGDYHIDYTLYGRPMDGEFSELAYYSLDASVENLFPPMLISVENEDTICEQYPVFTWTPAYTPSVGANLTYYFKMAEVSNFQTPTQAILSNPYYYSEMDIPITMLNYPVTAATLVFGQQYAWQVDAMINNQVATSSEIWSFVYGCPNDTIIDSIPTGSFVKLRTESYGGIYEMQTKYLPVAYTERYFKEKDKNLTYRIYEYNTLQPANTQSYPLTVKEGINYYHINVCQDGLNLVDGIYMLEVTDNAGTKWYMLFEKKEIECN